MGPFGWKPLVWNLVDGFVFPISINEVEDGECEKDAFGAGEWGFRWTVAS